MKRIYAYKGFEVTVVPEPVWVPSKNLMPLPPGGYIAVVHVARIGSTRPMVAPLRLMADSQRPFSTEPEALMSGFSAGQRIVDDTLSLEG